MMLKDYLPQDSKPFTDIRLINPPLKVRVHNFHNIDFYRGSLLGESKDVFLDRLAGCGLTITAGTVNKIKVRAIPQYSNSVARWVAYLRVSHK